MDSLIERLFPREPRGRAYRIWRAMFENPDMFKKISNHVLKKPETKLSDLIREGVVSGQGLIISLSGRIGAGKDTAASFIIEDDNDKCPGVKHISFASPLKEFVSIQFDVPIELCNGATPHLREMRETKIIEPYGKTVRQLLENVGMSMRRVHNDIWIDIAIARVWRAIDEGMCVVITDTRFLNEIDKLRRVGAAMCLIYRSEEETVLTPEDTKTHPSRWEFLKAGIEWKRIPNVGTKEDLKKKLQELQFIK